MRGGGYPRPGFLAPFFYQVTVLKMAIFYSNFTVIVCFLVIFVIIIIKITKIIIIIIIETIIIIIKKNSVISAKRRFWRPKMRTKLAELGSGGGGLGDSGNARKKTFFSVDKPYGPSWLGLRDLSTLLTLSSTLQTLWQSWLILVLCCLPLVMILF